MRLLFRYWICIMIFLTTFTNYMLRANMSVSIIRMVGPKSEKFIPPCKKEEKGNDTKAETTDPSPHDASDEFDWDENQVGDIMASYFYGYLVTLIPAGILSEYIGPWHVILWSSLASAVLTGLTPASAIKGHIWVIVNRVIIGMLGGLPYPALNVLIANWVPPEEKGKFVAATMGNTVGMVFTFGLVGLVTDYAGWAWGFYVVVIVMMAFCVLFAFTVTDSPRTSRWTSVEERNYILETQEGHFSELTEKKVIAPYKKMLTSFPFWALSVAQFGSLWGLNLTLTYGPKYMAETLGFDIKASAGLASLPHLARMIFSVPFALCGDWMRKKNVMSVTHIRKFFIIFSHFLPGVCFFLMRLAGCNLGGILTLLVLNQGFSGAVVVSHLINPQDLTPNFSGSCFAVMNFIGMTTGIFVPKITGALNVHYNRELMAANIIYTIGGGALVICGVVFIIFGSGKVQPWNEIKDTEQTTSQGQRG